MCEMCDRKDKIEKLHNELNFRFVQLQVELNSEGREHHAAECEDRIISVTKEMIAGFRKRKSLEMQHDAIDDLGSVLDKALKH